MKETYSLEDFDKVTSLLKQKQGKGFTDFKYTGNGMIVIWGEDFGWAMMNADEFNKMLDGKIKEFLKTLKG